MFYAQSTTKLLKANLVIGTSLKGNLCDNLKNLQTVVTYIQETGVINLLRWSEWPKEDYRWEKEKEKKKETKNKGIQDRGFIYSNSIMTQTVLHYNEAH